MADETGASYQVREMAGETGDSSQVLEMAGETDDTIKCVEGLAVSEGPEQMHAGPPPFLRF